MHGKSFYLLFSLAIILTFIIYLVFHKSSTNNIIANQTKMLQKDPAIPQTEFIPENIPANFNFKEPNKPPYYYAPMGNGWVELNKDWSLRVDSVISDNRCPTGAECVVAGNAEVKVQFQQPNVDYNAAYFEKFKVEGINRFPLTGELKEDLFHPVEIRANDLDGKQIGLKITLVDLKPYPDKNTGTNLPSDYVALFKIEPLK